MLSFFLPCTWSLGEAALWVSGLLAWGIGLAQDSDGTCFFSNGKLAYTKSSHWSSKLSIVPSDQQWLSRISGKNLSLSWLEVGTRSFCMQRTCSTSEQGPLCSMQQSQEFEISVWCPPRESSHGKRWQLGSLYKRSVWYSTIDVLEMAFLPRLL